jgi:GNAT superfamily N-acetyltransferase
VSGRAPVEIRELHPLVVHPAHQLQGIGTAIVQNFETQVQGRGAATIRLGTDDEDNLTSLGGVDLYPDILMAKRVGSFLPAGDDGRRHG